MEWLKTKMSRSVIPLLQKGYRNAADLLYPHRCPVCEGLVEKQGDICRDCGYKVRYITPPFCMLCGKPLNDEEAELCQDCASGRHEFDRGVAAFAYTKELKESIYRFKYGNRREYARFYGISLARLKGHIIRSWEPDVLVPVPLHQSRRRRRGFNQAELVARALGEELCIPVDAGILVRCVNTAPQKELDDKERAKNIKNAFQAADNIVKYKKIVLIDDIYTTGATIDACAAALRQKGAERVYFASVCTGRGF